MVDLTSILAIAGASSGGISLAINAINSRRAYLDSVRPKLNVNLTSDLIDEQIQCHLEIQNVGQHDMKIRSFRLYISDTGFNSDFMLGLANYNTNLFIHENKILNKMFDIEVEFNYENLVDTIHKVLNYDKQRIRKTFTPALFEGLKSFNNELEQFKNRYTPLVPISFLRPAFLFNENVKMFSDLKKMPENTFPQGLDIILFDPEAYQSQAKKDIYSLSDTVFRLIWEKNPAWAINKSLDLNSFQENHKIHTLDPAFEIREDQAILSVSPTELGIPETLAPMEKRSVNLVVSSRNKSKFEIKVNLWITSFRSKYMIFSEEITNNYHFIATPREWLSPIMI